MRLTTKECQPYSHQDGGISCAGVGAVYLATPARRHPAGGAPFDLARRPETIGSRIAMPYAKETLANYATEMIRDVVRAEVVDRMKSAGKVYKEPRIYEDLLATDCS